MIITNNELVNNKYKDIFNLVYIDGNHRDVLVKTRDKVYEGYELLTHPLSSSVKPNENPYKSILISNNKENLNYRSAQIIENAIQVYDKFSKNKVKCITEKIENDFKLIDLTVLESALNI